MVYVGPHIFKCKLWPQTKRKIKRVLSESIKFKLVASGQA